MTSTDVAHVSNKGKTKNASNWGSVDSGHSTIDLTLKGSFRVLDTAPKTYDRLFRKDFDYNNKLHRDDREHAKSRGLVVNAEEKEKEVPTLSSSEYGHRLQLFKDHPDRKHVRIAHVKTEFYRRNGIEGTS
ncbi:uncharacterized protein C5orf49 homolog isoform X2 [Dreissena polymorpha]|uniref:uncharacterized protein C5orf49 homolog isoform X2 n=1 Tax=Dreissena polymorpha TaxID=45954 RepID=UPI002264A803|nr:uncharacterized protein C5orf49 homolog isoform X2 [Dreissena polymorpha]